MPEHTYLILVRHYLQRVNARYQSADPRSTLWEKERELLVKEMDGTWVRMNTRERKAAMDYQAELYQKSIGPA